MVRALFVFGTRPEAIKMCPVIQHLRGRPEEFAVRVCVTGQHRAMLDQVLEVFNVVPDMDLNIMQARQSLGASAARILAELEPVFRAEKPDVVLVQGDTTTTFCGALAAFYQRIPVAHIEAGLRTGDWHLPFPEEMNRVLTARLATMHFAATEGASRNLIAEGVDPKCIWITGNSGIDAVLWVRDRLNSGEIDAPLWQGLDPGKKLIVVTAHRRESFGPGLQSLCRGLARLAERPDVQLVFPVHSNPHVQDTVRRILDKIPNILLLEPLNYVPFVDLMRRSFILITDSGGVQEEGPSLGKPILVMREKTERPEAVEAGTVRLVGTNGDRIYEEASRLLDESVLYVRMSRVHNPYGDGCASQRIGDAMYSFLKKN